MFLTVQPGQAVAACHLRSVQVLQKRHESRAFIGEQAADVDRRSETDGHRTGHVEQVKQSGASVVLCRQRPHLSKSSFPSGVQCSGEEVGLTAAGALGRSRIEGDRSSGVRARCDVDPGLEVEELPVAVGRLVDRIEFVSVEVAERAEVEDDLAGTDRATHVPDHLALTTRA